MKFTEPQKTRMGVHIHYLQEETMEVKRDQIKLAQATHHLVGKKVWETNDEKKVYRIQVKEVTLRQKWTKKGRKKETKNK